MQPKANSQSAAGPEMTTSVGGLLDAAPISNPFVGLRPFESTEALLFFGRDEQTTELLQQLHLTRFLAVVGSSGCGKSSLIRAGLIPKLKAGFLLNDEGRWRFATMKPGTAPLQNLAATLLAAFGEDPAGERLRSLVEEIEISGVEAVTEYLSRRQQNEETNILLLVDQFEEIFRFGSFTDDDPTEDPDEREQRRAEAADFVSIMLELTRNEAIPVYVVMTMRSDFLGDCDAFPGLPQAMNRSQYLVPRLIRQQRLESIKCPIRLCQKEVAPGLVVRVLDDIGDDPDQLPVMQHALMRTWEKFQEAGGEEVGVEHYEATGTIKGALSQDADNALEGMDREELIITERMFQALVETDAKGRRLRRPAHLSEIEQITGADRGAILKIIERFRSHNRSFLTLSEDRLLDDPLVDISHESLIRQWGTLSKWAEAEVESRELYLRLAGDAVRYRRRWVPLWSDPALQLALDWWEERRPNEAWAHRYHREFALAEDFLKQSEKKRAAEAAAVERLRDEQARREREEYEKARQIAEERRKQAEELAAARQGELEAAQELTRQQAVAAGRQRRYIVALVVFSAIMLAMSGLAVYAMSLAQRSTAKAEKKEREANSAYAQQKLLTKSLKDSLTSELTAKDEAEEQKANAEKNAAAAVLARQEAEAATHDANHQAGLAENRKQEAIDALKLANARKDADQLHRGATKEVDAVHYEQAQVKFDQAIKSYEKLGDYDGAAHTHNELGKLLIGLTADDDDFKDVTLDSNVLREVENSRQTLVKSNLLAGLLSYVPTTEAFHQTFNITNTKKKGLEHYGQAIEIYRNPQNKLRDSKGIFRDTNGSAAVFDKVGELLAGESDFPDDNTNDALTQLTIDSYCEAFGDYTKADNIEGQISMLTKIGTRIDPTQGDREDMALGQDEPDRSGYTGCDGGSHGAVIYYERAIPLYRKLIEQLTGKPEQAKARREEMVAALINIGKVYLRSDEDQARRKFAEAVAVYRDVNDLDNTVKTLRAIGERLEEGELKSEYYQLAADEYRKAGQYEQAANTLREIGESYYSRGLRISPTEPISFQKSLQYLQEARLIYEQLNKREAQAEVLLFIGLDYYHLNNPDEALAAYTPAIKLFEEVGDKQGQGRAHYYLGRVQAMKGLRQDAKTSFDTALRLLTEAGNVSLISSVQNERESLESTEPVPAPTPVPESPVQPSMGSSPVLPVELKTELTGGPVGGSVPKGEAKFEVDSDGDRRFMVKVKNVNFTGETVLNVLVDGQKVGTITLAPGTRRGKLEFESDEDQVVPQVNANSSIVVSNDEGSTIVAGSFSNLPRSVPNKKKRQ